jgi:hypothetical protein
MWSSAISSGFEYSTFTGPRDFRDIPGPTSFPSKTTVARPPFLRTTFSTSWTTRVRWRSRVSSPYAPGTFATL